MSRSENLRAALTMTAGMAAFAVSDSCMKALGQEMPLVQAMALRGAGVTLALGALALRQGASWRRAAPRDRRLMGWRALAEAATAWTYLQAIVLMPIANVSAIFQASPLAISLAGAWVLGERVSRGRWLCLLAGLAGVLLILRPGGDGWGWPSLLVVASVVFVTARDVAARFVARDVPSVLVAAVTAGVVTGLAFLASAFVDWQPLGGREVAILGLAQGALLVGYLSVVSAMRRGEVSFVAPFRHSSLLASLATGYLLFGTFPSALTLVGAAVVAGSGVALIWGARREAAESAAAGGTPPAA